MPKKASKLKFVVDNLKKSLKIEICPGHWAFKLKYFTLK
jgi:hypothetical protein